MAMLEGDTMNQEEQIKDWYFRYHTIFGKRYTKKQKDRFLKSLVADIRQTRKDLELYSFNLHENDKRVYRNLYVGDLKKAKKVICTYYDTPAALLGSYRLFDREKQRKKTTFSVVLTSIIWIMVGIFYTLYVGIPVFENNGLLSFQSILVALGYFIYFYLFNRLRMGLPKQKNLIRNTSSILMLLDKITNTDSNSDIAYAFVDAGCTSGAGLLKLLEQTDGKVYMLDSIGSKYPLYQVSNSEKMFYQHDSIEPIVKEEFKNNNLLYIMSAKIEGNEFIIPRSELKKGQLDSNNMNTVTDFLDEI